MLRSAAILAMLGVCATAHARQATFHAVGVLPGYNRSVAAALSADGSTVVGRCYTGTTSNYRAFRWTVAGGIEDLGLLPGGTTALADGVSADGSTVVGRCVAGVTRAFVWTRTAGMQELAPPAGATSAAAAGVSADGSVIAGNTVVAGVPRAFRWTAAGGAVLLPLPLGWLTSGPTRGTTPSSPASPRSARTRAAGLCRSSAASARMAAGWRATALTPSRPETCVTKPGSPTSGPPVTRTATPTAP